VILKDSGTRLDRCPCSLLLEELVHFLGIQTEVLSCKIIISLVTSGTNVCTFLSVVRDLFTSTKVILHLRMEYQHQKSENQIDFNLDDSYLLMAFMVFMVDPGFEPTSTNSKACGLSTLPFLLLCSY